MSYIPRPGTNVEAIYKIIDDIPTLSSKLLDKIKNNHPSIPVTTISNHLKFLLTKKVISKTKIQNKYYYARANNGGKLSRSKQILIYCQEHVGKRINKAGIIERFGFKKEDTTIPTILGTLMREGYLRRIGNTKPFEYLVLPEIKTLTKVPRVLRTAITKKSENTIAKNEVVAEKQPNFAEMRIGDVIQDYMTLKNENKRLREALQRIAHELVQVGEIE